MRLHLTRHVACAILLSVLVLGLLLPQVLVVEENVDRVSDEGRLTIPPPLHGQESLEERELSTRAEHEIGRASSEPVYFEKNKVVSAREEYVDTTIVFRGDFRISGSGKLVLRNCSLLSHDNSSEKLIKVDGGAVLVLEDVVVDVANASVISEEVLKNSTFFIESRGDIEISNTVIKHYKFINILNSNIHAEGLTLEQGQRDGIYFKSSTSYLRSLRIRSSGQAGINSVFSNLTIQNLTIQNATSSGVYLRDSVVHHSSALEIDSQGVHLDLADHSTFNTDNPAVKSMVIGFGKGDYNSKVVIEDESGTQVLSQAKPSTSTPTACSIALE